MDSPKTPDSAPSRPEAATAPFENESKRISYIRFLISNAAAGSVIGKGGTTISEFQSRSGARIQTSRNYEYFPRTTDRVVTLSGTTDEILKAFELILSKINSEIAELQAVDDPDPKANQVRLVVPSNVCGAIIGKGGATIRMFVENSRAHIKLSSQEHNIPGLQDRIITISGTFEQKLHAVILIIRKISEDSNYGMYASAPFSYTGQNYSKIQCIQRPFAATTTVTPISYGLCPYGSYGINNMLQTKGVMSPLVVQAAPVQLSFPIVPASLPVTCITIPVPDEYVGIMIGRGGRTISGIQQMSGARINISCRGDFVAGTTDRKVTITGTANCVYVAQQLLTQKVYQSLYSDFTNDHFGMVHS